MLRDAALMVCRLSSYLYSNGLMLKDIHPWNVLFDAGTPTYVDWGSISPLSPSSRWPYQELQGWYVLPLCLMAAGKSQTTRNMLLDVPHRPASGDIYRLLAKRLPWRFWLQSRFENRRHARDRAKIGKDYFESLVRTIESIPIAQHGTEWSDYYGLDNRYSHDSPNEWPAKVKSVDRITDMLKPETVLDVGCNRGWMSELVARKGVRVVAVDVDEPSINLLYQRIRSTNLPILPLIMDICRPTPHHGLGNAYSGAQQRLRSDLVLALAITHHLVFKRGLTFEFIARQLSGFTKRWLIVEFVPPDDLYVRRWINERFAWYSLDAFMTALSKHFRQILIYDSTPSPRVLLLCEK